MHTLVKYSDTLEYQWNEFANKYGTIFHCIAFKKLLQQNFGYNCLYHCLIDANGQIQALLPIIAASNIMHNKVGVSLPFINHLDFCKTEQVTNNELLSCLEQIKTDHSLKYLQIRLKETDCTPENWQKNIENSCFMLPLAGNTDDILALSTGSNRNHTRKVYKNNYFTVSFDQAKLSDFHRVYQCRMHELGSPSPDLNFFRSFFQYFPDDAFLLSIIDTTTNQVVGGMLLIRSNTDKVLYYPYGANLIAYNNKYLNNFMYFEAAKFGQTLGLEFLDLGRSPQDSGTFRYKKQWGATAMQLTYLMYFGNQPSSIPDKDNMSIFINIWRHLPLSLVNFLGARLIKNVLP